MAKLSDIKITKTIEIPAGYNVNGVVKNPPAKRKANKTKVKVDKKAHVSYKSLVKAKQVQKEKQLKEEKKYKTITIQRFYQRGNEIVFIHVVDMELRDWLQNYTQIESAYNQTPRMVPSELIPSLNEIKKHVDQQDCRYLAELHKFLGYELEGLLAAYDEMKEKGVVSFDLLFCLFPIGTEVSFVQHDEICGGIVRGFNTYQGWTGQTAEVSVERITTNGRSFCLQIEKVRIKGFSGSMSLKELHIKPMEPETKTALIERGKKFIKYALGAHYVQYKGNLKIDTWFGSKYFRSDGRIMIDAISHDKRDSDKAMSTSDNNNSEFFDTISEDRLAFHNPYLKGFSFSLKMWGGLTVSQMEDIQFNEKAFDILVLDQSKKDIITALVKNYNTGFKDIIQGKSGGAVLLLHGKPGGGKSLTAEALAETMKKPLYSVSVGELGINPQELESKLREILDIAQTWDAVILIDEADIFLEARNEHDIIRNAMVGVFLRLLEYHQGVLFLTTNRVKNFDTAFHSRISVALHYKEHTGESREKIWTNLLKAANVDGLDVKKLATYEINGRQIKTTIRLAQALAADRKETLSMNHIEQTIGLHEDFKKDMSTK